MIVTFTDFGAQGPYLGQMELAIRRHAPSVPVVHLQSDAPVFDPKASAYLLAALAADLPEGAVVLGVVDPGVGGARAGLVVRADGRWLVGPDNGLFEPLMRRAGHLETWEIMWRPPRLSASFHGRDLFAPVTAALAIGRDPEAIGCAACAPPMRPDWPDDFAAIIYHDHYGNAWTGLRAQGLAADAVVSVGGLALRRARTFTDVGVGEAFWYVNSSAMVEIAVNCAAASLRPEFALGAIITIR